jgi:hypothetical protein
VHFVGIVEKILNTRGPTLTSLHLQNVLYGLAGCHFSVYKPETSSHIPEDQAVCCSVCRSLDIRPNDPSQLAGWLRGREGGAFVLCGPAVPRSPPAVNFGSGYNLPLVSNPDPPPPPKKRNPNCTGICLPNCVKDGIFPNLGRI